MICQDVTEFVSGIIREGTSSNPVEVGRIYRAARAAGYSAGQVAGALTVLTDYFDEVVEVNVKGGLVVYPKSSS